MFKRSINILKNISQIIKKSQKQFQYNCHITAIEQDKHENYIATIQITNKRQIFKMRPEEILADDKLTDCFSQRDIRTLTYLGYLGINSPKYRILAQRLSETDNRLVFAIKKRSDNNVIIKTAAELSADEEIIKSLDQKDAHMLGYTTGSEQTIVEKNEIGKLLKTLNDNKEHILQQE